MSYCQNCADLEQRLGRVLAERDEARGRQGNRGAMNAYRVTLPCDVRFVMAATYAKAAAWAEARNWAVCSVERVGPAYLAADFAPAESSSAHTPPRSDLETTADDASHPKERE